MPKSANQKLRLLFEREILLRETDEENKVIVLSVKVGPFLSYRAVWLHLKGVVRLVDLCGLAQEQDICLLLFDALPITV